MDYEMPVCNGIEATEKLVKRMKCDDLPVIPIVALTAYLDEKKKCMEVGMKGFLSKPATTFTIREVLTSLSNGEL